MDDNPFQMQFRDCIRVKNSKILSLSCPDERCLNKMMKWICFRNFSMLHVLQRIDLRNFVNFSCDNSELFVCLLSSHE